MDKYLKKPKRSKDHSANVSAANRAKQYCYWHHSGAAETLRMLGVFVLEFEHLGSGPRP